MKNFKFTCQVTSKTHKAAIFIEKSLEKQKTKKNRKFFEFFFDFLVIFLKQLVVQFPYYTLTVEYDQALVFRSDPFIAEKTILI